MEITEKRFTIINLHPMSTPPTGAHIQQLLGFLATMGGEGKKRKTLPEEKI